MGICGICGVCLTLHPKCNRNDWLIPSTFPITREQFELERRQLFAR